MPVAPPTANEALRDRLGTRPPPDALLAQALTHSSYLNETDSSAASNERLEFLGDAVLGMVIGDALYRAFPDAGEGVLTRLRADIVRGSTLAKAARRLHLGDHLVLGRGEEAAGGRHRASNLAGALEALIGAAYHGQGYRAAKALCLRLMKPELHEALQNGASLDAKSTLQHLVQARGHEPRGYVTVEEYADGGARQFTVEVNVGGAVLGRGAGPSKREAQQRAACEAVAHLSGQPRGEG